VTPASDIAKASRELWEAFHREPWFGCVGHRSDGLVLYVTKRSPRLSEALGTPPRWGGVAVDVKVTGPIRPAATRR
jgi:hypothetical protein